MSRFTFLRAALCFSVLTVCLFAQNPSTQTPPSSAPVAGAGTFSGRLSGAGMDGATITVTNTATGVAQTTTTDSSGAFSFANLMPGSYRVAVKTKAGVQLTETTMDVSGSGSNQVQVTFTQQPVAGRPEIEARSPTLETRSAEVARAYDSHTIRELPVIDRQNSDLITLMPGVTPPVAAADRINDPQRTRSFNVNGLPSYANLYNQDGAYDNEPFHNRPLRVEPNEAVQDLEVRTSNYNAEYGVSAGSWSSILTRPGTNAIHGSLFEFHTNNFFQTGRQFAQSPINPRFNRNQFGATLGGALIPSKLFWFFSYEGFLQRGFEEAVATVPPLGFAGGNFSTIPGVTLFNPATGVLPGTTRLPFSGNQIPASSINPAAANILSLIPSPNAPGFTNNVVGQVRLLDDTHRIDGKIDERFSEKSTGFLRYGFTQGSVDQGSLLGPLGAPLDSEFHAMNAVASMTHIFSKNFLTELRFGYDRYRNQIAPWDLTVPSNFTTAFPNGVPSIDIFGFSALGLPPNVPRKEIDNVYDGAASFMWHTGMHNLKFGVYGRELQSNGFSNPYFSGLGSFTFGPGATLGTTGAAANLTVAQLQANAFAAFLTGNPSQAGVSGFFGTPTYRERQFGAYLTDTINLFHKFYLELGVRWDVFVGPETGVRGGSVVFDPVTNTAIPQGFNNISARIARTNLDNVAPRIGLAFRPFDRFVFRAGYGVHFFALPFSLEPFNPAMFGTQVGLAGGLGVVPFRVPTLPTLTGATAPNLPFFVTTGRDLPTPYVQTYSAGFQGDLGNGFLMDIGYVGNLGRELPYFRPDVGLPGSGLAGLGAAGFPAGRTAAIVTYGTGLTSNYNSAQVNLTKKFGAGLAFSGAYTYGKALDYGTNLIAPFSRRSNYGPADWDRTHILAISHVWKLPFGPGTTHMHSGWASRVFADWELNGILRWATGTPYTATFDPTACACLGAAGVPATFNSPFAANSLNGSATFNPAQFSSPAAGTFGTLSRNAIRGPDFFVYNAALFRNFTIRENTKLELRGEVYNLTNTTNPVNPVASAALAGFGSTLGSIDGLAGRQFQVAIRLLF